MTSLLSKALLVNEYPVLLKAISNDEVPIPGYVYKEVAKITFDSEKHSQQLLELLIGTLENHYSFSTYKVLKLLRYLVQNGHPHFRKSLRRNDGALKEATSFTGSTDTSNGFSYSQAIRNEAKVALQLLFDPVVIDRDDHNDVALVENPLLSPVHMTGMGSSQNRSKYEGFGSSPHALKKTITDKVVESLTDWVGKMFSQPSEEGEIIEHALTFSCGSYKPVEFDILRNASDKRTEASLDVAPKQIPLTSISHHIDEEERSNISADSLERNVANCLGDQECQFVEELLKLESSNGGILKRMQLQEMCRRYSSLNCDEIISILKHKLPTGNEDQQMKMLHFLDALLHYGMVSNIGKTELIEVLVQMESTTIGALKQKARKLALILQHPS